ncbi:MAG: hypothetical protein VKS61_17910 [Candidatus Sericytochromatia bacterium]|nr:hypothetical protein [Candidatus Sericytochromatia bacterium]
MYTMPSTYPVMPAQPPLAGPSGPAVAPAAVGPTQLLAGAAAGLQSARAWQKSLSASRRSSRPRYQGDYGGSYGGYDRQGHYRQGYSRRSNAQVGVGAGTRVVDRLANAVRSSVVWGAVISTGLNLWALSERRITGAQASANVVGDVMGAAVGGAAGAVASAAGTALLGGMLGTGLMMWLTAAGLGIAGYVLADAWLRQTRFFNDVQAGVLRMFS